MPVTDLIADMLTVVRNGSRAKKEKVDVKRSRMNLEILDIFKKEGYVKNSKSIDDKRQGVIRVYLKYEEDRKPFITQIKRVSKPGLRVYVDKENIPKVQPRSPFHRRPSQSSSIQWITIWKYGCQLHEPGETGTR